MRGRVRFAIGVCSLLAVAAVNSSRASEVADECHDQGSYDACMAGVSYAYTYCMQQHPGDPQSECLGMRTSGEASCWADFCFVLPDLG